MSNIVLPRRYYLTKLVQEHGGNVRYKDAVV